MPLFSDCFYFIWHGTSTQGIRHTLFLLGAASWFVIFKAGSLVSVVELHLSAILLHWGKQYWHYSILLFRHWTTAQGRDLHGQSTFTSKKPSPALVPLHLCTNRGGLVAQNYTSTMAKLWIVSLRRFYGEHFKAPGYVTKVRNFKGDPFGYSVVGSLCGLKMVKGHPIFFI